MDVADEMNQKGEVAGTAPLVVIRVTKALHILVELRDAIPLIETLALSQNSILLKFPHCVGQCPSAQS